MEHPKDHHPPLLNLEKQSDSSSFPHCFLSYSTVPHENGFIQTTNQ